MDRFRDTLRQPVLTFERRAFIERNGVAAAQRCELRQFALQPIVGPDMQGVEALFRAGSRRAFSGDPDAASRVMLDNWLLFGFDELIGGHTVFLNCTRETLLSGYLSLLPQTAVLEILESVQPDEEVLRACRQLKAEGYRVALDDFESAENMEGFLELADFIKVDFRRLGRRERARVLSDVSSMGITLIAEKIESRDEFLRAADEGFELFQGYWVGQCMHYAKMTEPLDPITCARVANVLENGALDVDELAELISEQPGLERRVLRRANWLSPADGAVLSVRDALEVLETPDLERVVTLAIMAALENDLKCELPVKMAEMYGGDPLIRWIDAGGQAAWWYEMRGAAGVRR
jgi:EAL and modified HD-GYP domain-containing signal transduction protein